MKSWLASLAVYRDRRILAILFMGFGSGLPLALTGSTLSIWLKEVGVSLTAIGLFGLVGIAYTFKFLWAPVFDRPLPYITRQLGRRRGWGLVLQFALAAAIFALGTVDPAADPARAAALAALVAFLSASQDIVIDAMRVELLAENEQGAGAAATQIGYRIAMIVSTAGALFLAAAAGWFWTYAAMAAGIAVGTAALLSVREPATIQRRIAPGENWFVVMVVQPFTDLLRRQSATADSSHGGRNGAVAFLWSARRAFVVLIFVMLYKLGDAMAGHMSGPFYITLGFSKEEIASITKVFGVVASMLGIAAGGSVVYRLGLMRGLLACGVLQALANLLYIVQAQAGHDLWMLTLTIGAENFAAGMGSAAFVAYLSSLCNRAFTATQYALLSALATVGRTTLSASGGWLIDQFGWVQFFLISTASAVPGLLLLLWLMRHGSAPAPTATTTPAASPDASSAAPAA
jgi:PAT family beta-lactamase induction signal transducer AmpG